jgi:hypothetical protein
MTPVTNDQRRRIIDNVRDGLPPASFAALSKLLNAADVAEILGGTIPRELDDQVLSTLLVGAEPQFLNISVKSYEALVKDEIAARGLTGRVFFGETARARSIGAAEYSSVVAAPLPGREYVLLLDGEATKVKLSLADPSTTWNVGGFKNDREATRGFALVIAALDQLKPLLEQQSVTLEGFGDAVAQLIKRAGFEGRIGFGVEAVSFSIGEPAEAPQLSALPEFSAMSSIYLDGQPTGVQVDLPFATDDAAANAAFANVRAAIEELQRRT